MPARSNYFQHLVTSIYEQLAGTGVRVTESKLVRDRLDESEREIDVALESEIGGHPVVIAVECRDHARRETVQWIDELRGKYENLPVDKVVAVARAGFTRKALERARRAGIEALTIEQATATDWVALVGGATAFRLLLLQWYVTGLQLGLDVPPASQADWHDFEVAPPVVLFQPDGTPDCTLQDLAQWLLQDPAAHGNVQACVPTDASLGAVISCETPAGTYVIGPNGARGLVREVRVAVAVRKETAALPLVFGRFNTAPVAHAPVESASWKGQVVMVHPPGLEPSAHLTLAPRAGPSGRRPAGARPRRQTP